MFDLRVVSSGIAVIVMKPDHRRCRSQKKHKSENVITFKRNQKSRLPVELLIWIV